MIQLERRYYERVEIGEITGVNPKSQNFKRNVENKLTNWGYSFSYGKKSFTITRAPETAQERLAEIIIRVFDIDIQVDVYAFACFISTFSWYVEFSQMPWDERAKEMKILYGITISGDTLKKWYGKLNKMNLITKDKTDRAYWKTSIEDGVKIRDMVEGDEELESEMKAYLDTRKELLNEYITSALASGKKDYKKITAEAWENAQKTLWNRYQCCFYSCGKITLNIIGECAREIFELVDEISEGEYQEYEKVVNTALVPVQKGEFKF